MKAPDDFRPFTRLEKYLLRDDEVAGLEGIDPDPLLPVQGAAPTRVSPGLIKLITAVISDAARILESAAYRGTDEYKSACHWAFLEHSDRPFSFNWCCDAINLLSGSPILDPARIRRELWLLNKSRMGRPRRPDREVALTEPRP